MPQFIFGDSYGDVGNRQLAYDAARDNRYFQMLADQRARDSAAQNFSLQSRSLDQTAQQQAWAAQEAEKTGQENEAYRWAQLGQNANLYNKSLENTSDLAKMQLLAQQSRLDKTDQSTAYNEAYQAIKSGSIRTPDQLENFSDKLTSTDKSRLGFYLKEAYDERSRAYGSGERATANMNAEYARTMTPLQSEYDKAMGQVGKRSWFWGHKQTAADVNVSEPVTKYNQKRDAFFQAFSKDKPYQGLTDYDTAANRFVNLVPQPTGFNGAPQKFNWPQVGAMPKGATDTGNYEEGNYDRQPGNQSPATGPSIPSAWVPWPRSGVKVHPDVSAQIQLKASGLTNPADQSAFVQAALAQALKDGTATSIEQAAPTAPSNGYNQYVNLKLLGQNAESPASLSTTTVAPMSFRQLGVQPAAQAASTATVPVASKPAAQPTPQIDKYRLTKWHVDDPLMPVDMTAQVNSRNVPNLSTRAVVELAKQLGVAPGLYYENGKLYTYKKGQWGVTDVSEKKLRKEVLQAANDQQYYVEGQ